MTSFGTTLSFVWLTMAICSLAQPADDQSPPVLDTSGQPLETGVEYYILPGITDVAGGLTLVNRNGIRCPFYVGQEPLASAEPNGTSVIFTPYTSGETIIRESRDLSVQFQALTICIQSTAWRVGEEDPETGRRFIVTAGDKSYFRIDNNGGVYNFSWCPTESCPNCARPRCGSAGILIEDDKRLLALDGPAFPFVFTRA